VVYVPILPDGSAGQPTVVIADPSLFGLDGITMDARGTIYGVANAGNKLVRISRDGTDISEIVSGAPLDFPTGLAFGAGREQHTLFVVNSAFIHFLSDPPMPGNANPAIIAVHVGAPGLSNR
jgi:sugar lactone lactonase YvrE